MKVQEIISKEIKKINEQKKGVSKPIVVQPPVQELKKEIKEIKPPVPEIKKEEPPK